MDTGEDTTMMQKQRRSTKFDFSGTNYEVQTMGYLAGIEDEHKMDPDLFMKICDKAKQASGAQKPTSEVAEDKFASMRLDPAFLVRASLRAKISGRAIHKETSGNETRQTGEDCEESENGKNGEVYNNADEANGSENEPEEVMDGENADCEASANEDHNSDGNNNDQDESGEDQLAMEEGRVDDNGYVKGYSGILDFESDLSQLGEDEEDYALTEDGSQA